MVESVRRNLRRLNRESRLSIPFTRELVSLVEDIDRRLEKIEGLLLELGVLDRKRRK